MSSRALRRAQREREQQLPSGKSQDSSTDEDVHHTKGKSTFEILGEAEAENDEESDDARQSDQEQQEEHQQNDTSIVNTTDNTTSTIPKQNRKKKRKKAKKAAAKETANDRSSQDEIEEALRQLSVSVNGPESGSDKGISLDSRQEYEEMYAVLAVDSHQLNVLNEMRRLFGDVSFSDQPATERHRQASIGEQIDLSEAVKGKYSASGAGLPAMIRRRNIFVQGREDWPKAAGTGLGMDFEQTNRDGSMLFKFTHNKSYQQSQKEFETCVQTMNPSMMVNLLRFNPYHISTLLQVSEIAKHEKDYETAGELLERALFAFGRALHTQFAGAVTQGKARIDFRRPENREFFLAAWRYVQNVGMRGTWRTAYEWCRLMFQLDPVGDPYAIACCIDQFALRARQQEMFLEFFECPPLWKVCKSLANAPNLYLSAALARHTLKRADADDSLLKIILDQPWLAGRLAKALDLSPIPPAIWGTTPPNGRAELQAELYAKQATDLWKTPDAVSFLQEIARLVGREETHDITSTDEADPITLPEARHILLLEQPALISFIPTGFTSQLKSASDPLPPPEDLRSYETGVEIGFGAGAGDSTHPPPEQIIADNPQGFIEVLAETHRLFEMLIPGFNDRLEEAGIGGALDLNEQDIEQALRTSQIPPQRLSQLFTRLLVFRQALANQTDRRVEGSDGTAAYLTEAGHLRIEPAPDHAETEAESRQPTVEDAPLEDID